jgi:hypothetical protein
VYWYHSSSLALDASGHPHISYVGGLTELRYAHDNGSSWQVSAVDTLDQMGPYTSLALDTQGRPRISYTSYYDGVLNYAQYTGSSWRISEVTTQASWESSLALDTADRPHISYYGGNGDLWYASYNGTSWQTEFVDHEGWTATLSSLALDSADQPHVTYFVFSNDTDEGEIRYARHDGTAWQIEGVERTVRVGMGNSLAVDTAGRPHISYLDTSDEDNDALKYAWFDGTAWQTGVVERELGPVQGTSLALDALDRPHISYPDVSHSSLMYASYDGTAWQTETVDSAVVVSVGPSLALDTAGRPHIGYYNSADQTMRYARYDGTAWQVEVLASGLESAVGNTSLALDATGRPHISFFDSGNALLKYAWYDGAAWQIETVDTIAPLFGFSSLKLDAAGRPHVSYYNYEGYDQKYAYRDGAGWHTQTVADFTTGPNSLAVTRGGQPHIVYWDAANADLRHAFYDGTSWQVEVVESDASGDVFLTMDSSDRLYLSYDGDGLKYATASLACQPVQQVSVAGPARLPLGAAGTFTATYAPTTSAPLLAWDNGAVGLTAVYSWTFPGTYTVTVTATNACSELTATSRVEAFCQPVTGTQIAGPARWSLGVPALYTATYTPPTASLPLTFTWSSGTAGPTAFYSWTATGTYTVAVTATNSCGQVGDNLTVTVFCQEPVSVVVAGPLAMLVSQTVTYQALVEPITASRPLSYTWDNGAREPTAAYSWTVPGTYTITVVVANACGEETAMQEVHVYLAWPYRYFLPDFCSLYYVPGRR